MYKLFPLFFLVLTLLACRKPDDVLCVSVPANASVRFRLFDAVTGQDLFYTKSRPEFQEDSLKATQGCYPNPLVSRFSRYQIPGSNTYGYTFDFPNLPNPSLNEPAECFTILLQWNSKDVDTVQWHYRIEQIENCELQILDFMQFNGYPVQKVYGGVYEYYALRK